MKIDYYLASGWEIDKETEDSYILKKGGKAWVHLILALFGWPLLFIPNIIYHFAAKKRIIIRKKEK